jgi:hypothetical protein
MNTYGGVEIKLRYCRHRHNVVRFTPLPHYPKRKEPLGTHWMGGCVGTEPV